MSGGDAAAALDSASADQLAGCGPYRPVLFQELAPYGIRGPKGRRKEQGKRNCQGTTRRHGGHAHCRQVKNRVQPATGSAMAQNADWVTGKRQG